ncbi:MAG: response regulator [Phycisphaerae bacterium]|nr:response regulator [Phycisphaerae bacterium]MDW8261789.1 response regulator [Phycisphaerales bacterium]
MRRTLAATPQPRISPEEAKAALERLERGSKPGGKNKRKMRIPFDSRQVQIVFEEAGGRETRVLVQGRNISARGIAVIHTQFMHLGRACRVELVNRHGSPESIPGRIQRCRLVSGRVHEIAIVFDSPIDVTRFAVMTASEQRQFRRETSGSQEESKPIPERSLAGSVLLVDESESNRQLHELWLARLGLSAHHAASTAAAESFLLRQAADLIILDLQGAGLELVRKLRAAKVSTPVLCLAGEGEHHRRGDAVTAGCTDFLVRPIDREVFEESVVALMASDPFGPMNREPIRSRLAEQPDTLPLVQKFVDQARTLGDMLRTAISIDDIKTAGKICQRLMSSGAGYGFSAVSEVSRQALAALSLDPPCAARARREIERVIGVLNRLSC